MDIYEESDLPPLLRVGLLHVQFETLHPCLDGNGLLGCLFITLFLGHGSLFSLRTLSLAEAAEAHRLAEKGGAGKIVLTMPYPPSS